MILGRITLAPSLDSFLGRSEVRDDEETIRLQADTIKALEERLAAAQKVIDEKQVLIDELRRDENQSLADRLRAKGYSEVPGVGGRSKR